jgi:hypothetical protein
MKKANMVLVCAVLALASMALIAELLPEIEAKTIVIPTLILMIGVCLLELRRLK